MDAKSTIKRIDAPTATGMTGAVRRAAMTLALMMLTTATAWADEREGDWWYSYDSGSNTLTITSYTGSDASVTTPTILGGHAVTAIGHDCFRTTSAQTYLTSVTVSEGVMTIGDDAFTSCSNLATISLPNSLTSIGKSAFTQCSALTSITIPNNVTEIGGWAFENSGLTDLYYAGTKAQWNNVSVQTNTFNHLSLTIHWQCTATYDMQGHGMAPSAQTVWSGSVLTAPTAPTATGYDFGGWYRNAACTQAFDFTAALDDNITLYAKWTALENTITFDLGGKGTAISDQTVTSGNTLRRPNVQFVGEAGNEEGIEGWYTDAARTVPYDFSTVVDRGFTLYAKWAAAGHVTMNVTNNEHGICRVRDELYQYFAIQTDNVKPIMPETYILYVKPNKGYSFSGSYTLTNRSSGTGEMPYEIVGGGSMYYTLDLTEKDVTINVTFEEKPILTIAARADDANVLSEVTWSVVNNQTNSKYNNGSTIPYISDPNGAVASGFGIRLDVNLGNLSGYAFTATITDQGAETTTYKNSNEGTSFLIVPYGSIDIDLHVYQPQSIALQDDGSNIDDIIAINHDVASVTLKRAFPAGKKQTVCLPFKPTELLNQGTVWEFTSISGDKVVMTQKTSGLSANKPYIFAANADINATTGIAFGNVTINYGTDPKTTKTKNNEYTFTFQGTYERKHWEASEALTEGIYGFLSMDSDEGEVGQFVKCDRNTNIKPFRAYLKYEGDLSGTETATARRTSAEALPDVIDIVWVSASGEATGIADCKSATPDSGIANSLERSGWWTLDGRRLAGQPSAKGLYINNGRKVAIK